MTGERRRPRQWFYFGPWAFSIDEAETLIADQPREPASLNVAAWANAYGLTRIDDPNPRSVSLIGPSRDGLDRTYAMGTDLTKPVIVATLEVDGKPTGLCTGSTAPGAKVPPSCPPMCCPPRKPSRSDTA